MREDFDPMGDRQSNERLNELKRWRWAPPKATLKEIEAATDQRIDPLRSRLIADTATASDCAEGGGLSPEERPVCPPCQTRLQPRGVQERDLQSQGACGVRLKREYGVCPAWGAGLFPPR